MCRGFFFAVKKESDFHNVGGLKTFWSLLHLEFDVVAFFESLIAFTADRTEMDEHVLSACALDEAKAFGSIEPFYGSAFHKEHSFATLTNVYDQ